MDEPPRGALAGAARRGAAARGLPGWRHRGGVRARADRRYAPTRTRGGARGRLLVAGSPSTEGRPETADLLLEAGNRFAARGSRLDAARTRLELARALAVPSPEIAVDTAGRARAELEALGALRDADAAAALLCSLGAKGRAEGRRTPEPARAREVLRLIEDGLSNREIAERLFISPKTAEHHVSCIYAKLGLRLTRRGRRLRRPEPRGRIGDFPYRTGRRRAKLEGDPKNERRTDATTTPASSTAETSTPLRSSSPRSAWSRVSGPAASATSKRFPTSTSSSTI